MKKLDLRKELAHLYAPSAKAVTRVDVPPMSFLMVDGQGDPNGPAFAEAVEALFALSYTIKFAVKKSPLATDYGVMPLEGLWWADDPSAFRVGGDHSAWRWTAMIMQPDLVTAELVEATRAEVARKKRPAALERLRFERFEEGIAAQTMHVGPFSEEGPTIERVHRFIEESGARPVGRHHEIYLSDIRRADPAKWKTVIRQPMR